MCLDIDELISFFSNREWALIIWGIIALIGMLLSPKLRQSLRKLVKTILHPQLLCLYIIGYIWAFVGIFLLSTIGLWNMDILKDSIVYMLFSLTGLITNSLSLKSYRELTPICLENIKLGAIISFYINIYNFNFVIELIGLPIIVFLAFMQAFGESSKVDEHKQVASCLSRVINIIGVLCSVIALSWLIKNWQIIIEENTILSLLLPFFLTVWTLPYIYALAVYGKYEEWFVSLYFRSNKSDSIYKYRRNKVIQTCGINLDKIVYISKYLHTYTSQTEIEFCDRLHEIDCNYKQLNTPLETP